MLSELDRHATYRQWRWWSVALRGLFAIVFGLFALASPSSAFFSLVMLFGIFALVDGVLALAFGTRTKALPRGAIISRGIISIVAGVLALTMPGPAGLALLILIGAWAITSGLSELYMAFKMRHEIEHEWLLGIEGVLSVAFGIMLLMSPLAGAIVLGLWVGAFALVLGGMMIATGFRLRELQHRAHDLRAAAA
jgi:uncharacterized membrane protein HdeD (DUF308 family)